MSRNEISASRLSNSLTPSFQELHHIDTSFNLHQVKLWSYVDWMSSMQWSHPKRAWSINIILKHPDYLHRTPSLPEGMTQIMWNHCRPPNFNWMPRTQGWNWSFSSFFDTTPLAIRWSAWLIPSSDSLHKRSYWNFYTSWIQNDQLNSKEGPVSIASALRLYPLKFPAVHLLHFEMDGSQALKFGSVLLFLTYQSHGWPPLPVTAIGGASQ